MICESEHASVFLPMARQGETQSCIEREKKNTGILKHVQKRNVYMLRYAKKICVVKSTVDKERYN